MKTEAKENIKRISSEINYLRMTIKNGESIKIKCTQIEKGVCFTRLILALIYFTLCYALIYLLFFLAKDFIFDYFL